MTPRGRDLSEWIAWTFGRVEDVVALVVSLGVMPQPATPASERT